MSIHNRGFLPCFGSFGQAVSEIFSEIDQPETRIAYDGQICQRISENEQSIDASYPFLFIWPSGFKEEF